MRWLNNGSSILGKFGGHQFAYEKLKGKTETDYNFFYTSNISLKTNTLKKYPFDPEFSGYGWEDIELGYRLHRKINLKLIYNKNAIAYHYHYMTIKDMQKRMEKIGESAWIIHKKYPELNKIPRTHKKIILTLLASKPSITTLKILCKLSQGHLCALYYYAVSKKHFLKGIKNKPKIKWKQKN